MFAVSLHGRVVVITGGSAGVGRAAAGAFARRGARLALLARDKEGLERAQSELQATGTRVEIFDVDVADAEAVFAAAEACEERLGPIDVWVNNAMATIFAKIDDLTPNEVRRVTEVSYLGYVHGTMAALRHMRKRDRGVIVQVGSSLAYRGIPLQAAYCGAKHAIQGFTDSLRVELLHDRSNIRVTTVHLPALDTPQFDWARTKRQKAPRPVAPVFAARPAGEALVHAARFPSREYWLGGSTALTILGSMLSPELMERFLAGQAVEGQDRDEDVTPDRKDNLMEPVRGLHGAGGSFGREARPHAVLFPAATTVLGLAAGALVGTALFGAAVATRLSDSARVGRRR